jgi:5-methylcytosine-specific restriction endonuclease McrA
MPAAGKWKTEIGWETIEDWHEEAGGFTKDGGTLTIAEVRRRCIEICGDAPSKGSISPHFNEATRKKIVERNKKYRGTIRGMLNYRIHKFHEKKDKVYTEPKENRHTSVYQMIRERLKELNGRNGMEADKYVEYWEKNENLTIVDEELEWRMPCKICGEELVINPKGSNMQLDHIAPHSRGGESAPDNVIPVHKMCNQSKTSMTMEEFIELAKKVVKTHV